MSPIPAALAALALAVSAAPQVARAEVVFHRPPPPGSTAPRIDIQIEPRAPGSVATPPPPAGPDVDAGATAPWFWSVVPAALPARPGRFGMAVATSGGAPEPLAPPVEMLHRIARDHGRAILRATIDTRVSPALALALIAVESSGRADAVSPAGAAGLMQLIPATADRFGVADRMDPADNIRGGVAYLDWLLGSFDGDAVLALAGYNAGEGAVRRHGGVPPFAETRGYVPKVAAAWSVARLLCTVPPDLPGDACVLAPTRLAADGT